MTALLFQIRFGRSVERVEFAATLDEAVVVARREPECPHVVIFRTNGDPDDPDAETVAARVNGEWSTFDA